MVAVKHLYATTSHLGMIGYIVMSVAFDRMKTHTLMRVKSDRESTHIREADTILNQKLIIPTFHPIIRK
jgi:hypothetical protein